MHNTTPDIDPADDGMEAMATQTAFFFFRKREHSEQQNRRRLFTFCSVLFAAQFVDDYILCSFRFLLFRCWNEILL